MTIRRSGFRSELGRSMIEMLGVLAIVGVLSVGGIRAYQKAMTKYKANKWIDDMQLVIANFTFYAEEWKKIARKQSTGSSVGVTQYVYDAGLVPPHIKQSVNGFGAYPNRIYLNIIIKTADFGFGEKCRLLFNQVILPQSDTILFVHRYGQNNDNNAVHSISYQGTRCNPNQSNCLKNFSLNDVFEACRYYEDEKRVSFSIYFK